MKKNNFPLLLLIIFATWACNSQYKIYYINSYHLGYAPSDEVYQAIKEVLTRKNVELKTFFMDTKRKNSDNDIEEKSKKILKDIEKFKPDVIIASDDNAVKYIVTPHLKNTPLPVVFCGVNWSCEQYNLPAKNITGMLEVLPLEENLNIMKEYFPDVKKLMVLSENSTSEKNNTPVLDELFKNNGFKVTYKLVDDFEEWKTNFKKASTTVDLIYLPTNGAVKNWDKDEAKLFVRTHTNIPTITCDDFMMDYAVFGLTKIAKEQGEWSANAALEILKGKSPSQISVVKNKKSKAYLNKRLAEKIGFIPENKLLIKCKIVE